MSSLVMSSAIHMRKLTPRPPGAWERTRPPERQRGFRQCYQYYLVMILNHTGIFF